MGFCTLKRTIMDLKKKVCWGAEKVAYMPTLDQPTKEKSSHYKEESSCVSKLVRISCLPCQGPAVA